MCVNSGATDPWVGRVGGGGWRRGAEMRRTIPTLHSCLTELPLSPRSSTPFNAAKIPRQHPSCGFKTLSLNIFKAHILPLCQFTHYTLPRLGFVAASDGTRRRGRFCSPRGSQKLGQWQHGSAGVTTRGVAGDKDGDDMWEESRHSRVG